MMIDCVSLCFLIRKTNRIRVKRFSLSSSSSSERKKERKKEALWFDSIWVFATIVFVWKDWFNQHWKISNNIQHVIRVA